MATKLSNAHLNIITKECKEYRILDVYIILAYMSSEVKNGKFLINCYTDNKSDLIRVIKRYCPNITYKTVHNCLEHLEELDILKYDSELHAWHIKNMERMVKSKSSARNDEERKSCLGYTSIRKFFLTEEFFSMKARVKRLIIYICQLFDSKASKNYDCFSINLNKADSSWLKILKTKCKYYAKKTIEEMLTKYSRIFTDLTSEVRDNDVAPKSVSGFKFSFKCSDLKNRPTETETFNMVKMKNPKEYKLVMDKLNFAGLSISENKIMHIIRAVAPVKEWFLKERAIQLIVNKLIAVHIHHSREAIKSIPAYSAAVVKAVVEEYKHYKNTHKRIQTFELNEKYYDNYVETNFRSSSIREDIEAALVVLKR